MNRRRALLSSLVAAFVICTGCERMSFMPQPRKRAPAVGYDAVANGMSEEQVRKLLGEPARRRRISLEGRDQTGTCLTYLVRHNLVTIVLVGDAVVSKEKI